MKARRRRRRRLRGDREARRAARLYQCWSDWVRAHGGTWAEHEPAWVREPITLESIRKAVGALPYSPQPFEFRPAGLALWPMGWTVVK